METCVSRFQPSCLSRHAGQKVARSRHLDRRPEAVRQIAVRALRRLREIFGDTESLGLPDRVLRLEEPGGEGEPHVE